ncbi:glycosyltransferase family 2 protein [Aeromicrobium sp.]|nr:glycosyltransferase family 2 protein [Candidatus Saccharibacteria bacterium]
MNTIHPELSVVVPVYNEQAGIAAFHHSVTKVLSGLKMPCEIIYCNDGSRDNSLQTLHELASRDKTVRIISFSRNFGKELAITAGIHAARGAAVLTIDADGQHPVQHIPEFVARWRAGAKVVVGVRTLDRHQGFMKRVGSKYFYKLFNRISGTQLISGSTDFRLIDHTVQREFNRLTERNRITRGLIDWLGYKQEFIDFEADERIAGDATYSVRQLIKLSIDSVISLSVSPLYFVAYIGVVVLPLALLLLLGMIINAIFGDVLGLHATGGAYIEVITLCLVGILMVSQGIIGLYLSHIHAESQSRPLYIIDEANSSQQL